MCTFAHEEKSFALVFTEQKTTPLIELAFLPDQLYVNEAANNLYIVKHEDKSLLVDVLPLDDLKSAEGARTIDIDHDGASKFVLVPGDKLAYLNQHRQVETVSLLTGETIQIEFQLTPDCSLDDHGMTDSNAVSDTLVFTCNQSLRLLISAFSADHRMLNTEGELHRFGAVGDQHYVIVRQSDKSFKLFNLATGRFVELVYRNHVLAAWADCFVSHSAELNFDCSLLLHEADDRVALIQRGASKEKWTREEGLAQIGATLLVDLPPGNTVDVDPYTWTFR